MTGAKQSGQHSSRCPAAPRRWIGRSIAAGRQRYDSFAASRLRTTNLGAGMLGPCCGSLTGVVGRTSAARSRSRSVMVRAMATRAPGTVAWTSRTHFRVFPYLVCWLAFVPWWRGISIEERHYAMAGTMGRSGPHALAAEPREAWGWVSGPRTGHPNPGSKITDCGALALFPQSRRGLLRLEAALGLFRAQPPGEELVGGGQPALVRARPGLLRRHQPLHQLRLAQPQIPPPHTREVAPRRDFIVTGAARLDRERIDA